MPHSLDGALAKVAHADRYLTGLRNEIVRQSRTWNLGFDQRFDPETNTITVTVAGVPDPPIEWSLVAADAMQNLRAALNYLVWELSRLELARLGEDREPAKNTQFPIEIAKALRFDRRRLADVRIDHVARIAALQPNGAAALSELPEASLRHLPMELLARKSHLGLLAALTNEDKHRILPMSLITPAMAFIGQTEPLRDCEIVSSNHFVQTHLENGTKWAEHKVRPTGPHPQLDVRDLVTIDVDFGGVSVTEVLPQLVSFVDQTIQSFAADFDV